ncbi:MAG: hypothetical protein LBD48_13180 [Treponema sp.]|jgi:hypothetical protein|nr:hypothetical protein [Treponema sp.]
MSEYAALHKKLMFEKFPRKLIQNRPRVLPELDGVCFDTGAKGVYDLVFAFVFNLDEMAEAVYGAAAQCLVAEGGCLYLAYPKKGNKEYETFIHRDAIFPRLGVNGDDGFVAGVPLKFFKLVALNETFTVVGLRLQAGPGKPKKNAAGRVDVH